MVSQGILMRHRKSLSRPQISLLILILITLVAGLTYFASYGVMMSNLVTQDASEQTVDRYVAIYRPLCRVMPNFVMCPYTEKACGLTDIEAFFLVQAIRMKPPPGARGNVSFDFD